MVIPVTEEPVILRCEILRRQELRNDKLLYAVKFVDMCEDEEVTTAALPVSRSCRLLSLRAVPALFTLRRRPPGHVEAEEIHIDLHNCLIQLRRDFLAQLQLR